MSTYTERVLGDLGPAFRAAAGEGLVVFLTALHAGLDRIDALTADAERAPGADWSWPVYADIDSTPNPGWLGQVVGVEVDTHASTEAQRSQVATRAGFVSGKPSAIVATVRPLLTGAQRVVLIERTGGDAYALSVRAYASEAGATTEAAIKAAVDRVKPQGIVVTAVIATGASYDHWLTAHGLTYDGFAELGLTYAQIAAHVPEEGTVP